MKISTMKIWLMKSHSFKDRCESDDRCEIKFMKKCDICVEKFSMCENKKK